MEYYAKSNDTKKEVKNVNDIRNILIYLLGSQMDKLNENESKMIISYLDSLKQQTVQEQKTLREHEKDIVNCAGKFFEIFDMYFTEKEKNLVLEACRVHDLGKANYIFQTIVNPQLTRIEAITSVLDTPYVDSNIRRILKAKLADITLNLNLYSDRRKLDGVDLNCINDRLDIHRTCLLYDFDEMTGRGMGLSLTKYDDEWNFI